MKKLLLLLIPILFFGCNKDKSYDNKDIIGNWVDVDGKEYPYLNLDKSNKYEYYICGLKNEDNTCGYSSNFTYKNEILTLKTHYGDMVFKVTFEGPDVINIYGGHSAGTPRDVKLKRR